jgi:HAD superfamily phosphatase
VNQTEEKVGYIKKADVLVRENTSINTDCLIFDVDGVLIDVSSSFREAIIETVQFYFEKIIKIPGEAQLMSLSDTQVFKDSGGFNNDWDLTNAAVLFFLYKLVTGHEKDLPTCKHFPPHIDMFLKSVNLRGSGLEAVREEALSGLTAGQKKELLGLYNPALVTGIFKEIYGGTDYCHKLYGYEPEFIKELGLINRENNLINSSLLTGFNKIGVLTGRAKEETAVALEKTGIGNLVKKNVMYDDGKGPNKPDPLCLKDLCGKMEVKSGVYIGDTMDDAMLIANYNATSSTGRFNFAAVTDRPDIFKDKADLIAADVNKIVSYLSK